MSHKPLHIFVDVQPLLTAKSGVGYYISNLLEELAVSDTTNIYDLVAFSFSFKKFRLTFGKNFHQTIIRIFPRRVYLKLLELHLRLPIEFLSSFHDVYFFNNFISFPILHGKVITVIHDITFIRYPEFVEEKNLIHLQKLVPPSIKHSDTVVAVSHTIKQEIMHLFSVPAEKVVVIEPTVNFNWPIVSKHTLQEFDKKHKLHKFILFLGNMEPRKNVSRLIKAYKLLSEEIQAEYPLVIAGGVGWRNDDIMAEMPGKKNIHYLGYVNNIDKEILYQKATLFVFPSLYEGFGMPLIEAMDHNIPVVTSNQSCMPEVAGNAAIYINPEDEHDIAHGILQGLQDEALREQLIEEGKARVQYYKGIKQDQLFLEIVNRLY